MNQGLGSEGDRSAQVKPAGAFSISRQLPLLSALRWLIHEYQCHRAPDKAKAISEAFDPSSTMLRNIRVNRDMSGGDRLPIGRAAGPGLVEALLVGDLGLPAEVPARQTAVSAHPTMGLANTQNAI